MIALSRHASFVPLASGWILCGHAFRGPRTVVDAAQRAQLEELRAPREVEVDDQLAVWLRLGILVDAALDEDEALAREFGPHVETVRAGIARTQMRARHEPRWRMRLAAPPVVAEPIARWRVVYLGGCLMLPGLDALIELGAARGCAIDGAASFPSDLALIDDHAPDAIVIGDLPRVGLGWRDERPVHYADALRALIAQIRARTAAPILVRNLIGPTLGDPNRVRAANLAIAELGALPDVHVIDCDQAVAAAGARGLVDDAVALSHHLGSLTWLVERADRAGDAAIADQLRALAPRDRLELEYVLADEDLRAMLALAGVGRRKLVIVDLDGTLWPGALAETGAPFPPDADVYPHHLYLGLHEALLALRDRGILLACASKNDRTVVEALWRYPAPLAGLPTLELADFVTDRIDWGDKADNLLAIAAELGLPLDAIAFIDDSPRERARVRERCPGVLVLGDNPFALRTCLLTDPAFAVPHVTGEARHRTEAVRGQLARERTRPATDPAAFRASLELRATLGRGGDLARIAELVHRTTQLNTTGERPSLDELRAATIYTLAAADRFADYGLVGACVVRGATIHQLVLSCRVLELGLEDLLLRSAAADLGAPIVTGRLLETARNHPARHLFARCGFVRDPDDPTRWTIESGALAAADLPYAVAWAC